jgi:hypothetical protein
MRAWYYPPFSIEVGLVPTLECVVLTGHDDLQGKSTAKCTEPGQTNTSLFSHSPTVRITVPFWKLESGEHRQTRFYLLLPRTSCADAASFHKFLRASYEVAPASPEHMGRRPSAQDEAAGKGGVVKPAARTKRQGKGG